MNSLAPITPKLAQISEQIEWLPGSLRLMEPHQIAGQQPDNLCGPYWVSILLKAYGVSDIDPARLGQLAGSVLPIGDDPQQWVPPGASSRQDYAIALPTCPPALGGTSALGLMEATLKASSGGYALIPLQTTWTAPQVETLLRLCHSFSHWEAVPLANVRTGSFWGSRLSLKDAIAHLEGNPIQPSPADWSVGHFVTLAGIVKGTTRSLVIVRDTYPILGWDGYHLQPPEAIAASLNRDDGTEGGIFLFVATHHQPDVEQQCRQQGWAIEPWDNGTPYRKKEE
ncbi:hypothetical protein H6G89_04895 [Oscillatoria sp. FACHB-1407]|uniref:DUF6885 family protein n=1 Tax=Oscillatoria sp. FACHB-1407 TaxID=2692847 RepID=UPI001687E35D|nr:hypothetical protein [Oscillatoria sp. FACHB-1407]MBD2460375.1 hypothetical protein [Oscillatoria sp. FACHB-1407]